jgi:hypothetical protein
MKSNFDSPMALLNKRQTLRACGPLNWNEIPAPEANRVKVVFTITQGLRGNQTQVHGDSDPVEFGRELDEWMFEVDADKQLHPGPAGGHGALYSDLPAMNQPSPYFEWDVAITLTQRDIPEEDIEAIVRRVIAEQ